MKPLRCSVRESFSLVHRIGIQGVLCREGDRVFEHRSSDGRVGLMNEREPPFDLTADPDERVDLAVETEPLRLMFHRRRVVKHRARWLWD